MNVLSRLWSKLTRSKRYRAALVSAQAKRGIPTQIRALLKQHELTQVELAKRAGLTQGVISRAADPDYGNLTMNTIVKIAAGFDVAFIGEFVPYSDFAGWYTNLSEKSLDVPKFEDDGIATPGPDRTFDNVTQFPGRIYPENQLGTGDLHGHQAGPPPRIQPHSETSASTADVALRGR